MRVNLTSESSPALDAVKVEPKVDKPFSDHMRYFEGVQLREHIQSELAAIEEQGKELYRKRNLVELKKYREMIAEFIRGCVSQGLGLEEHRHTTNFGRTKMLTVIKTINEKLLSLAQRLISENSDPIEVLALVDEIRGLLLDLYV